MKNGWFQHFYSSSIGWFICEFAYYGRIVWGRGCVLNPLNKRQWQWQCTIRWMRWDDSIICAPLQRLGAQHVVRSERICAGIGPARWAAGAALKDSVSGSAYYDSLTDIISSACVVRSAQLAMKYLSSVIDALTGSHSHGSGGVYSAVSTQEPSNPYTDPIYAPTTHPSQRSLNPAAAVFDRFLQGRLHQEKQRTKCESHFYLLRLI